MPLDGTTARLVWAPQPGQQHKLVTCPYMEILFGGARGGGKTDGVLGKWAVKAQRYGVGFNGVFFRHEMPQADDLIERAKEIYLPLGAEWREQPRQFRMPGGGRVRFRPLENVVDASKYQGQNLTDCAVEEAGNFADPKPIDMLFGALRSKGGVPVQLILTANPGGVGQQWIKHRYIDPAPRGMTPLVRKLPNGAEHRYIYIPSRIQDNRILLANDPTYINRLHLVGSPELVRAWLEGDWNVIAGAFFPEFSAVRHIIPPCTLPEHWARFRSFDWGSARPFAVHWWAVSDGGLPGIARGCLVCYREWYGMKPNEPNVGLRMTAEQVAEGIRDRERDDPKPASGMMVGVADPAIFAEDGGPSIASRMTQAARVVFRPADNKRVPQRGAMGGWDQLRSRLVGDADGRPMVVLFSTCRDIIRTLPAMQHDASRAEDIDTESEDHAVDSCFVAGTMIETARGAVPIERVTLTDQVMTRSGYQPVIAAFSVGERPVMSVRLSTSATLTGTDDHPVWVEGRGFIPFRALRYGDMMRPCQSSSSVKPFKNSWASRITSAVSIISAKVNVCIALCGSTTTVVFRGARTFITETWIPTTISPTTSPALPLTSTCLFMAGYGVARARRGWRSTPGHWPPHGMDHPLGSRGTSGIGNRTARRQCMSGKTAVVTSAAMCIAPSSEPASDFAQTRASRNGVVVPLSMMLSENALDAATHSAPINTVSRNSVAAHAPNQEPTRGLWRRIGATIAALRSRLKTREPSGAVCVVGAPTTAGRQRVYNLSVAQAEEYFANGVLGHNCRYAMMSRPYVRDAERQKPRDSWDAAFNRDAEELRDWRVA